MTVPSPSRSVRLHSLFTTFFLPLALFGAIQVEGFRSRHRGKPKAGGALKVADEPAPARITPDIQEVRRPSSPIAVDASLGIQPSHHNLLHLPIVDSLAQAAHNQSDLRDLGDPFKETAEIMAREASRITSLNQLLALMFMLLCCIYSAKVFVMDLIVARGVDQLTDRKKELMGRYISEEARMATALKRLEASPAMIAEQQFKDLARGFQEFLDALVKGQSQQGNNIEEQIEMIRLVRRFVRLWLCAFEPCCLDPLTSPRRILREAELCTCTTIQQLASLTSKRMVQKPMLFLSETWDSFVGSANPLVDINEVRDVCWLRCAGRCQFKVRRSNGFNESTRGWPVDVSMGCLVVTLFCWSHVRQLAGVVLGALLFPAMMASSKFGLAAGVGTAEVLLLMLLLVAGPVNVRWQLQACINHLKQQRCLVEGKRKETEEKCRKAEGAASLWEYRTIPHLTLFKQLSEVVCSVESDEEACLFSSPAKEELLKGIVDMLEKIDPALGELWMWTGSQAFRVDKLQAVAEELEEMCELVNEKGQKEDAYPLIVERLDKVRGFAAGQMTLARGNQGRVRRGGTRFNK